MSFYGDAVMPEYWSLDSGLEFTEMSTAIVRVFTSEGFVIAADGRARIQETETVVSDSEQKLFIISRSDRALVYSFAGNLQVINDSTGELVVDVISEIRRAIQETALAPSRHDLNWYVSKLWKEAHRKLILASKSKDSSPFPVSPNDPGVICHVFFYGYYRNVPVELDLRFMHEEQTVVKPRFFPTGHLAPGVIMYGSERVATLLFRTDDFSFSQYRTPAIQKAIRHQSLTLSDGIEIAESYIHACDSNEGRAIDSTICAAIGGHIHIAAITPQEVKWIKKPAGHREVE